MENYEMYTSNNFTIFIIFINISEKNERVILNFAQNRTICKLIKRSLINAAIAEFEVQTTLDFNWTDAYRWYALIRVISLN